jgi:hypothetical protein
MTTVAEVVFAVVTLAFAYEFTTLRFTLNQQYERATLVSLLEFRADVPFQYRALVLWVVNLIAPVVPKFHLPPNIWLVANLDLDHARAVVLVEMSSVVLLVFSFRWYLKRFFKNSTLCILLSFTIFYGLSFNFLLSPFAPFWYPYDVPGLLFFTIGLTLLYKEQWGLYYPLFLLATFNRETSVLLSVLFLFTSAGKHPWKWIAGHIAIQAVLWTTAKLILYDLYGTTPGHGIIIEEHLLSNLEYLTKPKYYPILLSSIGYLWIPTLLLNKYISDSFVRKTVLASLLFIPAIFYSGSILELRVYLEFIPIYLTGFLLVLQNLFKTENEQLRVMRP